ncbi:MAG: RDD family protein [Trebonia sp.]
MTGAEQVRTGQPEFVPALPPDLRLASRAQVAASFLLGLLLFAVTLGIGYIGWSVFTWGHGQTPAQRIISLRCWLPQDGRVAGRDEMAIRQVLGLFLSAGLVWGFFVWLLSKTRRSAGDLWAGTVVLYDPCN